MSDDGRNMAFWEDECAALRAEVDRLAHLHRENASTMEVQAIRMRERGISCGELEYAIAETRAALSSIGR